MGRKNEVIKILKNHLELLDSGIAETALQPHPFCRMGGQVDIIKISDGKRSQDLPPFFTKLKTPIQLAQEYKHPETVKILLALGADANAMEGNKRSVRAIYAVENHDLATARILLQRARILIGVIGKWTFKKWRQTKEMLIPVLC